MADSRERQIQDAVMGVLGDAADELMIDARPVRLLTLFPESRFQQRALPAVVVERFRETNTEAFTHGEDSMTYAADVWMIDAFKPSPEGEEDCRERLANLRERVEAALWVEPYLRLEVYSVMPGFWRLEQIDELPTQLGNKLMRLRCRMEVPLIVQKRS